MRVSPEYCSYTYRVQKQGYRSNIITARIYLHGNYKTINSKMSSQHLGKNKLPAQAALPMEKIS